MKFTASAAAFLALISSACADTTLGFDSITSPTSGETFKVGDTLDIIWEYNTSFPGTVTIHLIGGASTNLLNPIETIASNVDSTIGHFSWIITGDVGSDAVYGLNFTLDTDAAVYQYSFPFHIESSGSSSTTGTVSSTSSTSSASTTSSSPSTTTETSTTTAESSTTTEGSSSGNYTATGTASTDSGATQTTFTTTTGSSATGSATTSSITGLVTAGAGKVATGGLMALGGMAAALLAL